jgi:hypothetical protein
MVLDREVTPSPGSASAAAGSPGLASAPAVEARRQVRVLFINDTARNGGPGRSLYYILKFLDPRVVHRAVVLPRAGVISELYARPEPGPGVGGDGGGDRARAPVADELVFEPNLVENPIEPFGRAMVRADYDAPLPLRAARLVGNVGKGTAAVVRLAALARRERFDLLYCNGTNADFAGGALARLTGIRRSGTCAIRRCPRRCAGCTIGSRRGGAFAGSSASRTPRRRCSRIARRRSA